MRRSSRSSAAALHLCDRTLYQPQPGALVRAGSGHEAGLVTPDVRAPYPPWPLLFLAPRIPRTKTPGPFRPGAADRSIRASVVLEASRGAGALVAPPVGIGRGEAVVAERLVDVLASALGHVAGVAQALVADLVRPAAEDLVLAPGARQEGAEKKPGRQAG